MGTCNSAKSSQPNFQRNLRIESSGVKLTKSSDDTKNINYVYSIKQFGNTLVPINEIREPLKFEFKIFDLKGKSLPDNKYYIVKVIFADEKNTFVLPIISGTHPKFNFEKLLSLDIMFNKLDSTFLEVYLYSLPKSTDIMKFSSVDEAMNKASLFSMLKVDLLTVAIGPEHHDLCFKDVKKPFGIVGRCSFNITCSHIEKIKLNIKNLECKVFHLVQNEVGFKLKFKESHNIVESEYTDAVTPNLIAKEEVTLYSWIEPDNSSKDSQGALFFDLNLSMHELLSSNASINIYDVIFVETADSDKETNPRLQRIVDLHMLKKQTLTDEVTKFSAIGRDNSINLKPKFTQIGFANLNFYKILSENDNIITKQSSRFFNTFFSGKDQMGVNTTSHLMDQVGGIKFQVFGEITKPFTGDIYFGGNIIGKMDGNVEIHKIPLIRQIMCGVHTENGFDISSINLNMGLNTNLGSNFNSLKEDTAPPELRILSNQSNNLLSKLLKGTNLTQVSQSYREINIQILLIMEELKGVLKKSYKESCLYYNYLNNRDLYKAQKTMIELGINILRVIESFNLEQRGVGFEILVLINNRAEFDLGTVWRAWFMDDANTSVIRDNVLINEKIIENFIHFNNLCLDFALDRLSKGKSVDKESRVFVEFFLSVAYFRIPKFRRSFIEEISKDLYTDIKTFKEFEKGNHSIEDFLNLDPINSLILWDVLFYKRLENALKNLERENNNENNEISDKLNETESVLDRVASWKERIAKKGGAFYSMIIKLEKYIQHKVVKNMDIKWHNIPGFDIIIMAIGKELQTKEVTQYPSQLVELLTLLVNDSDIVNNFARLIIHRTNVFDTSAVFTVVKIIDALFSEYEKKRNVSNLNIRFDYQLLKHAFRIILENDHSLSVAKFFWLYYRNSHIMSFEHIAEVFLILFEMRFYHVFFHWSWQVRNVFYYFILFIINFRVRNLNFTNVVDDPNRGIRRGSYEMMKSVSNYPEVLKKSLLKAYQEKIKVIEKLKLAINEESLDPTFNTTFRSLDNPEFKDIPRELSKNIAVAMHHFGTIEKEFVKWEYENRRLKFEDIKYPVIDLEPPKDDVIQYSSENW